VDCYVAWLEAAAREVERPLLVANVGDPGVLAVVERLGRWPGRLVCAALGDAPAGRLASEAGPAERLTGSIVAADAEGTVVRLEGAGLPASLDIRIGLAGRHNAANALGVAGAALALGVAPDLMASALGSFAGVGRRLERKGEGRGVVVYDDYGHHPTAIRETLAAIRQKEPGRRVWAVYEPLTYHRTAAMIDQFAEVLAGADAVAIAQIWASRDPDTSITSAAALAEAVARRNPGIPAAAPGTVEETAAWLATQVRDGDAVLVMGGGRSYVIAEELLKALRR